MDAAWRKSIAAIRALGILGHRVAASSDTILAPGLWSKFTIKRLLLKSEWEDSRKLSKLIHLSKKTSTNKIVLFPMEMNSVEFLSMHRNTLCEYYSFLLPSPESIAIANSKIETFRLARKLNIRIPATLEIDSSFISKKNLIEIENMLRLYSSLVLKPNLGSGSQGVRYIDSLAMSDLLSYVDIYKSGLVQERISDTWKAAGVSLLFDEKSNCVLSFEHVRLKEYPNSGGPSTSRISVAPTVLTRESIRILRALNWVGVAMVEWKISEDNQDFALMEINPRFWGSLALAERSNANFVEQYFKVCKNQSPKGKPIIYNNISNWVWPGDILRYATSQNREPLREFICNSIRYGEEFTKLDIKGSLAQLLLTPLLIFKKSYRKNLRR